MCKTLRRFHLPLLNIGSNLLFLSCFELLKIIFNYKLVFHLFFLCISSKSEMCLSKLVAKYVSRSVHKKYVTNSDKHNHDTCLQAANHCAYFGFETVLKFSNLEARLLFEGPWLLVFSVSFCLACSV